MFNSREQMYRVVDFHIEKVPVKLVFPMKYTSVPLDDKVFFTRLTKEKSMSTLTYFYSCFTFFYALLYWFLFCELRRKRGAKSFTAGELRVFVISVVQLIPAGSVWKECGPPPVYIFSQSACHWERHSVPATNGLFETRACRGTAQSGEWMPSLDPYRCRGPEERSATRKETHFELAVTKKTDPPTSTFLGKK